MSIYNEIVIASTVSGKEGFVKMYEFFNDPDSDELYIVYELLTKDLNSFINSSPTLLTPPLIRSYLFDILSSISTLHYMGITHRDLKPLNICLDSSTPIPRLKLIDFGNSITEEGLKQQYEDEDDFLWGTDNYFSPESYLGYCFDHYKADMWSVGIIFFKMLTKKVLFNQSTNTTMTELPRIFKVLGTPTITAHPSFF